MRRKIRKTKLKAVFTTGKTSSQDFIVDEIERGSTTDVIRFASFRIEREVVNKI